MAPPVIVSLTLNPALDKTLFVRHLTLGDVNRVLRSQLDPAGKGVNVSRVVHRLGIPTTALGFLAGHIGQMTRHALDVEGVTHRFVWIPGETRLNVIVFDDEARDGTPFYDQGPEVEAEHLTALHAALDEHLAGARVLVAAGSLPPGVPEDVYADIIRQAKRRGVTTILDADGDALRLGLAGHPDVIKPNRSEAEALLGRPLPDRAAIIAGARELLDGGVRIVIVSLAGEGSICVTADRVVHAKPPSVVRKSTVGSGDSLVAGVAIALATGKDLADGLRLGTAAGAATAMTPGTHLGTREEIEGLLPSVEVREINS